MALVKLYAARDGLEAGFIRAWLEQHELHSVVLGDNLSIARGELPMTVDTLPAVWINEEDAPRATELMKTYFHENQQQDKPASWKCSGCGETIEGQFDQCWHCGRPRQEPSPAE
jgi:hypothetical protein